MPIDKHQTSNREHRLCAFMGPESFSAIEGAGKQSAHEHTEAAPKSIADAVRVHIEGTKSGVGAERERLAGQYRQLRGQLEQGSRAGMSVSDQQALRRQMHTMHDALIRGGITLTELGIPDPKGESQRQTRAAAEFLQANIHIEYTPGMTRNGNVVRHPYGNIPLLRDQRDHEYLDVFVGPKADSPTVFIMDQAPQEQFRVNDPEKKCLVGFPTEDEARQAYLQNYPPGWKAGPMRAIPATQFTAMVKQGNVA